MDNREYILDRIKKLTKALYRVTDLLSDKEPFKWTLRDNAIDIYSNFLKDKNIILSDIINILDLFSPESSISNLNYDILKKEYKNLKSFIEENKETIIPSPIGLIEPLGPIRPIEHHIEIEKKEQKEQKLKKPRENTRKDKILELLKDQSPRTIGEIMPFFEQISEKSIQRDLIDLVRMGKVATEGEKRWRKYRLLTNITI